MHEHFPVSNQESLWSNSISLSPCTMSWVSFSAFSFPMSLHLPHFPSSKLSFLTPFLYPLSNQLCRPVSLDSSAYRSWPQLFSVTLYTGCHKVAPCRILSSSWPPLHPPCPLTTMTHRFINIAKCPITYGKSHWIIIRLPPADLMISLLIFTQPLALSS